MAKEKEEIQIVLASDNYKLMTFDREMLKEIISDNLGANGGLSQHDLDKIKIPSGGGTTWEIPTASGITESKEVKGFIVSWKETRGYWKDSFDETGGGTPPDCESEDGMFGIGTPGGICAKCPLAEYGSAEKGEGQACKLVRHLFLVRETGILPIMVNVSPASNKVLRQYFMRLASEATPYWSVLTSLTLDKEKNAAGISYAKVNAKAIETLDPTSEKFKQMKEYRQFLLPALEKMKIEQDQG